MKILRELEKYGKILFEIECDKCKNIFQTTKEFMDKNPEHCSKCNDLRKKQKEKEPKKKETIIQEKKVQTTTYILVEKDTNICKIGKSDNLQARIFGQGYDKNDIQGLISSGRINLEESIYINEDMEKQLHENFKHWRIKQYREESGGTEWFVCADQIIKMMNVLRIPYRKLNDFFNSSYK